MRKKLSHFKKTKNFEKNVENTNIFLLKVDYSDDPRAVRIAAALWWYYASKLFELLGNVWSFKADVLCI